MKMLSLEQRFCSGITRANAKQYARELSNMIRENLEDHTGRSDGAPWVIEDFDNCIIPKERDRKRGRLSEEAFTGNRTPKLSRLYEEPMMTVDPNYGTNCEGKIRQRKRGRSDVPGDSDNHGVQLRKRSRSVEESLTVESDLVARIRVLEAELKEKNQRIRSLERDTKPSNYKMLGMHVHDPYDPEECTRQNRSLVLVNGASLTDTTLLEPALGQRPSYSAQPTLIYRTSKKVKR